MGNANRGMKARGLGFLFRPHRCVAPGRACSPHFTFRSDFIRSLSHARPSIYITLLHTKDEQTPRLQKENTRERNEVGGLTVEPFSSTTALRDGWRGFVRL